MSAPRDLANQKFGMLTGLGRVGSSKYGSAVWKFSCDCGNEKIVTARDVVFGKTQSCGCLKKNKLNVDLVGRIFGRLTALRPVLQRRREWIWECSCSCGGSTATLISALTSGNTLSCGCLQSERTSEASYKGEIHAGLTQAFNKYRWSAKKRNLSFNITREFAVSLFVQNCHYCGCVPGSYETAVTKGNKVFYTGIDRKDNGVGYEEFNCLPSCFTCNSSKRTMPYETFIEKLRNIGKIWGDK